MTKNIHRNNRLHLLDTLRGFSIIYVVIYHALFNLAATNAWAYNALFSPTMEALQFVFVSILIFISGICTRLTRSNLKRGLKTLAAAILVTAVSAVAAPKMTIIFGILHFFATAMLIYALIGKLIDKFPPAVAIPLFTALWLITYNIYDYAPRMPKSIILFILGFNTGHTSGDYYPIIPHLFLFLLGAVIGRFIKKERPPRLLCVNLIPPISFIGRHTLFIYLIHQPILYGISFVLSHI